MATTININVGDADWKEDQHKRDHGKFSKMSGGKGSLAHGEAKAKAKADAVNAAKVATAGAPKKAPTPNAPPPAKQSGESASNKIAANKNHADAGKALAELHGALRPGAKYNQHEAPKDQGDHKFGHTAGVRDWGKWVDNRRDPEDDAPQLHPDSQKQLAGILQKIQAKYPNVDLFASPGEKGWLELQARGKSPHASATPSQAGASGGAAAAAPVPKPNPTAVTGAKAPQAAAPGLTAQQKHEAIVALTAAGAKHGMSPEAVAAGIKSIQEVKTMADPAGVASALRPDAGKYKHPADQKWMANRLAEVDAALKSPHPAVALAAIRTNPSYSRFTAYKQALMEQHGHPPAAPAPRPPKPAAPSGGSPQASTQSFYKAMGTDLHSKNSLAEVKQSFEAWHKANPDQAVHKADSWKQIASEMGPEYAHEKAAAKGSKGPSRPEAAPAKEPYDFTKHAMDFHNSTGASLGGANWSQVEPQHKAQISAITTKHPKIAQSFGAAMQSSDNPAEQRKAVMQTFKKLQDDTSVAYGPANTVYKMLMQSFKGHTQSTAKEASMNMKLQHLSPKGKAGHW